MVPLGTANYDPDVSLGHHPMNGERTQMSFLRKGKPAVAVVAAADPVYSPKSPPPGFVHAVLPEGKTYRDFRGGYTDWLCTPDPDCEDCFGDGVTPLGESFELCACVKGGETTQKYSAAGQALVATQNTELLARRAARS